MIPVHVTVFPVPTFLLSNVPDVFTLAVTVSPLTIPDNVALLPHVADVVPSYVLLLAVTVAVNVFAVIFAVVVALLASVFSFPPLIPQLLFP